MTFRLPYQKDKAIKAITDNDKELICELKKPDRSRSSMQNRYYWFIIGILEQDTGYLKWELHALLGSMFRKTTIVFKDQITEVTRSTTSFTTLEMEDYLSKIRTFASSELGIYLPKPNETIYDFLKL